MMLSADERQPTLCPTNGYLVGWDKLTKRVRTRQDVVWEVEHGSSIPKGFVVHHKNGNKLDNQPKNLILITRATHFYSHPHPRLGTGVGYMDGAYYVRPGICADCGREIGSYKAQRCRSCACRASWKAGVYARR